MNAKGSHAAREKSGLLLTITEVMAARLPHGDTSSSVSLNVTRAESVAPESSLMNIGSAFGLLLIFASTAIGIYLLSLFFAHVRLFGGPAPVRRFLPKLIDLVEKGRINPGKVFDLTLPLDQVAEGYRAMDERRAIKTLLRP